MAEIKKPLNIVTKQIKIRTKNPISRLFFGLLVYININPLIVLFTSKANGIELLKEVQTVSIGWVAIPYAALLAFIAAVTMPTLLAIVNAYQLFSKNFIKRLEIEGDYKLKKHSIELENKYKTEVISKNKVDNEE